jgi:hypothetical protein
MKKKDEASSWIFPELFKLAVSKDKDVNIPMRLLSVMGGAGLLIIEPIMHARHWLNTRDSK